MVPDKMARTKWHGQNGTDKMVYGQNGMGQNGMDKMVWTKWYGQNGTEKMVVIFRIDYNSSEFNSYLVTKIHSEMINIQRRPKRLKVEAGLMKNHVVDGSGINVLIDDFIIKVLSIPFCPYHFVRTILSNTILSVYHFVHTIFSVPFCPLPFCPRTINVCMRVLAALKVRERRTERICRRW